MPMVRLPDAALLKPCEMPDVDIQKNGDLIMALMEMMSAHRQCASQITALRVFYEVHDDTK